jgi:hypothetical protein
MLRDGHGLQPKQRDWWRAIDADPAWIEAQQRWPEEDDDNLVT